MKNESYFDFPCNFTSTNPDTFGNQLFLVLEASNVF